MLLSEYAVQKNILEKKHAKVLKVVPAGTDGFTLHYRIDGQKYRSPEDVSKKTVPTEVYNKLEVDDNGILQNGVVVRRNNFLVWEYDSEA